MAKADDTGIKDLGGGRFQVRVKRLEARTGLVTNRKEIVSGSRADARRVRDRLREELASTVLRRPRTRLGEYAASWLERRVADGEIADTTARKYGYGLSHIIPAIGDLYLDAITRVDVKSYVADRVAKVGLKGGNTVRAELRLLRTIARDSVAEGYAEADWADRVKPPKVRRYSKDRPNRFTAEQGRRVLAAVPSRWKGIVMLMFTTGLRWGEASALHWEDIDPRTREATIKYGNRRGVLARVKTDSSYRTVPILPEVLELFGLRRPSGLVFTSRSRKQPGRLTAFVGNPLVKVFRLLCTKLGVPYTTPHGLRRTFTNLGRGEAAQEVRKAISGQSTDEMVEHYSHIELDEKEQLARAVASKLGITADKPKQSREEILGRIADLEAEIDELKTLLDD
ncbi:MAG: tyrosine-type recombinase/integrase [Kofleriaceae bacterium]